MSIKDERMSGNNASATVLITTVNDEPPVVSTTQRSFMFPEDSPAKTILGANVSITDADDRTQHQLVDRVCAAIANPSSGDKLNTSFQNSVLNSTNVTICISLDSCATNDTACHNTLLRSLTYINTEDEPDLNTRTIMLTVTATNSREEYSIESVFSSLRHTMTVLA